MGAKAVAAARTSRAPRVVVCCLAALAAACSPPPALRLPSPSYERPKTQPGRFKAGFGRADITPPPGLGLAGNGAEGRRARGYRTRLYARALVLEDKDGERLAIVATDLGFTSAQLQRRAAWIAGQLRHDSLGPDRLIVTATHTHSGPGNFLDALAFNLLASSVRGYDQAFAESLARGLARALADAIAHLRPASVAWGQASLWGFTRNRSTASYIKNLSDNVPNFHAPAEVADSLQRVDPTWLMLRVDYPNGSTTYCHQPHCPAGAFSVFAIHGTTNAEVDSFYDGDIQGLLERGLERHIDSINRDTATDGAPWPVPHATHLLANGTEGDVSPVWPAASRCPPPVFVPIGWRPGPRAGHPAPEWLEIRRATAAGCIVSGREFAVDTARAMTKRVAALFDSLGGRLSDTLTIGVAFDALSLQGSLRPGRLCEPAAGLSALAGAPDGRTRLMGWRLLGFIGPTITDGLGAARAEPVGCKGTKRALFWWLQWTVGKLGAVPDFAQFTVARVGDVVLATAPAELTTVAGELVRKAVIRGLGPAGDSIRQVGVVSLANGHLNYVTTDSEYAQQRFEGAFNLYGSETAAVFADYLGELAERLAPEHRGERYPVPELEVTPGAPTRILHLPQDPAGPAVERRILHPWCKDGVVTVEWIDERPELLLPHDGPLVRIEERRASSPPDSAWRLLTWDDDPWVEVLPLHAVHRGHLWRLRWAPHPTPAGTLRVRLEPRAGEPDEPIGAQLPENCFASGPGP